MENQLKHLSSGVVDRINQPQNQGISAHQSITRGQSSTPPTPSLSPERQSPALSSSKKTKNPRQHTRESIFDNKNGNDDHEDKVDGDDDETIDPNETEPEMTLPPPLTLSSSAILPTSSTNLGLNKYDNSFTFPHHHHHQNNSNSNRNQNAFSFPSTISTTSNLFHHLHHQNQHQNQHQHHNNGLGPHSIPSSRPVPSAEANNPTLYLPFPTPSPTSPFLTSSISGSSSSNIMGVGIGKNMEPSPFLAPLQGMTLFEGAISLDMTSPIIKTSNTSTSSMKDKPKSTATGNMIKSDSMIGLPRREGNNNDSSLDDDIEKEVEVEKDDQEEAANVLLAFSSPDVMKPTTILNMTPIMKTNKEISTLDNQKTRKDLERQDSSEGILQDKREDRKGTSESEDFILDDHSSGDSRDKIMSSSSISSINRLKRDSGQGDTMKDFEIGITRGKTAREILQM